jgi:hypothetical protein
LFLPRKIIALPPFNVKSPRKMSRAQKKNAESVCPDANRANLELCSGGVRARGGAESRRRAASDFKAAKSKLYD